MVLHRVLAVLLSILHVTVGLAPFYETHLGIDGQFLIGVEPDHDPYEVKKTILLSLGSHTIDVLGIIEEAPSLLFANFAPKHVEEVCGIPGVAYVEQNAKVTMQSDKEKKKKTDTASDEPEWNLDRINQRDLPLDGNADYGGDGGKGVHVYMIDTGILREHQDFGGREKMGYDKDPKNKGLDCNGHGTHASAIAVGKRWGIAHNATVHAVRAIGCRGHVTKFDLAKGINYVYRKHRHPCVAQIGATTDFGGSRTIDEATIALSKTGCVVVTPSGNDGSDSCEISPSKLTETITVGALGHWDYIHPLSNWGKCVDLFAPGQKIRSAWYISRVDNDTLSGTSMAASHVTGAVALKLSRGLKPEKIKGKLIKESTKGRMHGDMKGSPSRILYIKPPSPGKAEKKPAARKEEL